MRGRDPGRSGLAADAVETPEALFYCSWVCLVIMVEWFSVVLSLLILSVVPPKIVASVTKPETPVSRP